MASLAGTKRPFSSIEQGPNLGRTSGSTTAELQHSKRFAQEYNGASTGTRSWTEALETAMSMMILTSLIALSANI